MYIKLALFTLTLTMLLQDAKAMEHVTTQSTDEGTITVQVADRNLPSESWHISVTSHAEGHTYSVVYSMSTGTALVTTPEFSGPVHNENDWSLTSLEPQYFGTVVHSDGTVVYPPGFTPPGDLPPMHIQGQPSFEGAYVLHGNQIQFFGCSGSALVAVGSYLIGGQAAMNFMRGAVRGSVGGPGSAFGAGSLMTILGATALVIDSCFVH